MSGRSRDLMPRSSAGCRNGCTRSASTRAPANGEFGEKTQAALAQFQLSVPLPASGQLDPVTRAHLGVDDYPISADASAGEAGTATPEPPDTGTGGSSSPGLSAERTAEPKPN